ncbi:hypothetical protein N7491_005137 [Penicillium cf. griseofulvum]|uniref:Uncharacterized protein n=1 Tax=Penicillium cf. griseofulvum TaxID=2972120 RepID=A0A9W9M3Y8_9EURO|nr:hypothetical protein N7472_007830 [Penicillium cf. griseofulvum]KAJ5434542.1 hypothetical protein N7491_005137 [Penicillium cf. griseofulvum]KAJ5452371.1 hypothetical protein N7445_000554 [Penicillium cf. griseofulvum]
MDGATTVLDTLFVATATQEQKGQCLEVMSNAPNQIPPAALSQLFSLQGGRAKTHVDRHMNYTQLPGTNTNKRHFDLGCLSLEPY